MNTSSHQFFFLRKTAFCFQPWIIFLMAKRTVILAFANGIIDLISLLVSLLSQSLSLSISLSLSLLSLSISLSLSLSLCLALSLPVFFVSLCISLTAFPSLNHKTSCGSDQMGRYLWHMIALLSHYGQGEIIVKWSKEKETVEEVRRKIIGV